MITNFLAFLLLFVSTSIRQNNLIEWSAARKLTWDDFKATPNPASSNAALTSSSINIEFGYDNTGLDYSIKCSFDKTKSWVRIKNDVVLGHEQGHFDLAEVHARKLYKAMKEYKFNLQTVSNDVNKIYADIMKLHAETQNKYDQETDYSRNKVKQDEWQEKIEDELKGLDKFASYQKKS